MKVVLSVVMALLALAIGILHFSLDFVLFRGRFFGGGRPGGPGGLQGSLPQLFVANLILFAVLAILLLSLSRARTALRAGVDVLILAAALATLVGWNSIHRPNPRGLGAIAASLEIALIVLTLVHILTLPRGSKGYHVTGGTNGNDISR